MLHLGGDEEDGDGESEKGDMEDEGHQMWNADSDLNMDNSAACFQCRLVFNMAVDVNEEEREEDEKACQREREGYLE